jgi:hypothetical protein
MRETQASTLAARLMGSRRVGGGGAPMEGFEVDCPTCGQGAASIWSLDDWTTVLVECHCAKTPAAWALSVGLSPRFLAQSDRDCTLRFDEDVQDLLAQDEDENFDEYGGFWATQPGRRAA